MEVFPTALRAAEAPGAAEAPRAVEAAGQAQRGVQPDQGQPLAWMGERTAVRRAGCRPPGTIRESLSTAAADAEARGVREREVRWFCWGLLRVGQRVGDVDHKSDRLVKKRATPNPIAPSVLMRL